MKPEDKQQTKQKESPLPNSCDCTMKPEDKQDGKEKTTDLSTSFGNIMILD